jgi:hypothetical protein
MPKDHESVGVEVGLLRRACPIVGMAVKLEDRSQAELAALLVSDRVM